MPRKLRDSVVVITGASSGIGRATALRMAKSGATLVVAARSGQALSDVVSECRQHTLQAISVPTDVADLASVQALRERAIECFGRIDVWINNAAVSAMGRFEDIPIEIVRRVIETNLIGYIHGARAALDCFREQGTGVLINISSQVGIGGQPYAAPYVITKYAIRGLTDCLRQELLGSDIRVCTVLPGSVDTPHYEHAANYTGRAVKPLGPRIDPDAVASAITRLAERPQHERIVGRTGYFLRVLHGIAPSIYERAARWKTDRDQFQDATADQTEGNVFASMPEISGSSGGWRRREPAWTRATAIKIGSSVLAGLVLAGLLKMRH